MIILEQNFKWHLEAFASELFICIDTCVKSKILHYPNKMFWGLD